MHLGIIEGRCTSYSSALKFYNQSDRLLPATFRMLTLGLLTAVVAGIASVAAVRIKVGYKVVKHKRLLIEVKVGLN